MSASALRPIHRLGIANRGEAAMRCLRTVKALRAREGSRLEAVAFFTSVDRDAPFVRHADLAHALPTRLAPVQAYLDHDALLEAFAATRCDAVWPGWGFVSEHPDFADRVAAAGLAFLGPSGDTMRALGDKISARRLAEEAGVPGAAWSGEAVASEEVAAKHAERIGFPLLVKAAAGGGGRGIRIVRARDELGPALRTASAEARAAFGDARVFLERKVEAGRHVEVQIAADARGRVLALGARDCSVQRRHQKLIEEAPPPHLDAALVTLLERSAVELARRTGYVGVGTVEFLVTRGEAFFLEMNPRLQVEHGITEEVTGLDLVELQIRIARGEALPARAPKPRGVAIQARVCAEDPAAGFAPAPGRVVRFDAPLGPRVRVDASVSAGTDIPAAFDSLVAKVIASGETRDEARARLVAALSDFELVIAGGAHNKGVLVAALDSPALRAGGVDTEWLDRFVAERGATPGYAAEALVAAAILTYQQRRHERRLHFYADLASASIESVPPSVGQRIDLSHAGNDYRVTVLAVGAWRYRVQLDGETISARLQEDGAHAARLGVAGRELRVLHDATDAGLRVEIEGSAHRFGWQGAGEVRAGSPALVVAVHVAPGDEVEPGQALGVLEAMKTEIAFHAPLRGTVREICARRGQQVTAGDVLVRIDPSRADGAPAIDAPRLALPPEPDPLAPLFGRSGDGGIGVPDLAAAVHRDAGARRAALAAARDEIRRTLLGYDADAERSETLVSLLEAELPADAPPAFLDELAILAGDLATFADLEQLFIRTPRASVSGELGPSNAARLRAFVRRMRAEGAGIAPTFLDLVRAALRHYGVNDLAPSDALERALMRLLASQRTPALRRRLVLGLLRRAMTLARAGCRLDPGLAGALERIASMRGLVPDTVADAAEEARWLLVEGPELERAAARARAGLDAWLASPDGAGAPLPVDVLMDVTAAPREVFDTVGRWLTDTDERRRALALAAHLRRLYLGTRIREDESWVDAGLGIARLALFDGRKILGAIAPADALRGRLERLRASAVAEEERPSALELFVPDADPAKVQSLVDALAAELPADLGAGRLTVGFVGQSGDVEHRSFAAGVDAAREITGLHGLHPELAARLDVNRLVAFTLERLDASDGIVVFHGRSRELPDDERIFVLADVRVGAPGDGLRVLDTAAFERVFHAATRRLRSILTVRDAARRLQWNRLSLFVSPAVFVDDDTIDRLVQRLEPETHHLGLEKVIVRLTLQTTTDRSARPAEVVIAEPTAGHVEVTTRAPHHGPLRPATEYERRMVEARRRRLVVPYEIVRMLTAREGASFEEWDLVDAAESADDAATTARPVERPPGANPSGVVFGILSTPSETVPDGRRRVLVLSDPTRGMGALAAPECDRLVAAIDLAERLRVPVEWVAVSAGARIAMDSGTENLDATARVVRRIVEWTDAGGTIHVIVDGVNVGAQSYFDALATMGTRTRGALVMTPSGSLVLTGRAALEASGSVAAADELEIGGYERVMGPNGEAHYYAPDLAAAFRLLEQLHDYSYVVPGETGPRRRATKDVATRSIVDHPYVAGDGESFRRVGEIFDAASNPERKRPFAMRAVMEAVIDRDGGHLERWRGFAGAETAIVWDARVGGFALSLIGIESQNVAREGYRPGDGPSAWTGGTLFPLSSKKIARALYAASGNRPAVILANLSGFDGSPESMRKLQLEYGAEIARAVVRFEGPLLFLVVSRYHGGAYVVFSRELGGHVRAAALEGSYASVIGGGPAAAVVLGRQVHARTDADPRVVSLRRALAAETNAAERDLIERAIESVRLEKQTELAHEFDAVHTVERALRVGSLEEIIPAAEIRGWIVRRLEEAGR